MANYRKLNVQGTSVLLADPADITHTFKASVNVAPKMAGKVKLSNVKQEYVTTINPTVTVGTESGKEAIVIKTTVSGSSLSKALIDAEVAKHNANVALAIANSSSGGFAVPDLAYVV